MDHEVEPVVAQSVIDDVRQVRDDDEHVEHAEGDERVNQHLCYRHDPAPPKSASQSHVGMPASSSGGATRVNSRCWVMCMLSR